MSDVRRDRTRRIESTTTECPLCRNHITDSPYLRHTLVLQDESDTTRNRRTESRLCPSCWEGLFSSLSLMNS